MLLFTLNPFDSVAPIPQPGPVFIHETECERYAETAGYPTKLVTFQAVVDGYDRRIDARSVDPLRHGARWQGRLFRSSRRAAGGCLMVEPWLRGTMTETDAVRRGVLHALELAREDAERWCADLTDAEMNARPFDVTPVAFHLRHIARSLDRLLTYAEGRQLSDEQMAALRSELDSGASTAAVLAEMREGLVNAARRVTKISPESYEEPRGVGRKMLPATVGGLLVHCAEHTQRHVGQAVTTAKILIAARAASASTGMQ